MYRFDIPGRAPLELIHLVLDLNGTICVDGTLVPGVAERITALADELYVHVLTADTRGLAAKLVEGLPVQLAVLAEGNQDAAKRNFIDSLGASCVCAVGNGLNDRLMLRRAALGVGVVQAEGAFAGTLAAADIISVNILDALDLLLVPDRLVATLRR